MAVNPADLRRALNAVAMRQGGYFTARQARDVGYSYQAQKYHVDRGNWTRIDRGLFRIPDWPVADSDRYVLWRLWSGDRAIVSHESALTVHDISDVNPTKIHLTVPVDFRADDPAVILHKTSLPPQDIEERPDFRVTTVERTLLDVAAGDFSQEQLDTAVSDALERGLSAARRLRARSDEHGERAALRIERALGVIQ
ncbi:type IV toxin-antitoxin system AbiEi family antitoxin domain-containing protein [Actinophytocola sediminis]